MNMYRFLKLDDAADYERLQKEFIIIFTESLKIILKISLTSLERIKK